jgi:hypothetical protein
VRQGFHYDFLVGHRTELLLYKSFHCFRRVLRGGRRRRTLPQRMQQDKPSSKEKRSGDEESCYENWHGSSVQEPEETMVAVVAPKRAKSK